MVEIEEILVEKDNSLFIPLLIQPRSSKSELVGVFDKRLKVKIAALPIDNSANKECKKFLSKLFKTPKTCIHIIKGLSSRKKLIKIDGLTKKNAENFLAWVGNKK